MDATDAEKEKARRVQLLLYTMTVVMIGVPVLLFFLRGR